MNTPKKTESNSSVKKVIWAIDAFPDNAELQNHLVETLQIIQRTSPKAKIYPTYIISADQLNLGFDLPLSALKQYVPRVKKALDGVLAAASNIKTETPKVLISTGTSTTSSVKALMCHAKSVGAGLILAGTHGRKGVSRLFLGSFVETLLLYSDIPVLTVGSQVHQIGNFEKILFPSDLSKKSEHSFKKFLKFAQNWNSKVTLLYVIPNPIEPVFQAGVYLLGGGWVPLNDFMNSEKGKIEKKLLKWKEMGQKYGVEVSCVLESNAKSVTDGVDQYSKAHAFQLIAMAAQSGKVASRLLGSISRQMARMTDKPLLIIRSP
jgi:nucleotide-binding universal stress UspA family protein